MAGPSGLTSRLKLPYPIPDDNVDVPRDMLALSNKLDSSAAFDLQGTNAARPAPGTAGRYYYATDTGTLYRDDGTAWNAVSLVDNAVTTPRIANGAVTFAKLGADAKSSGAATANNAGPTYAASGNVIASLPYTTRGAMCLMGVTGYFRHDTVQGQYANINYGFQIDGVYITQAAAASFTQNGWVSGASGSTLVSVSAGAHTFQYACGNGAYATIGLYGWMFWVAELV